MPFPALHGATSSSSRAGPIPGSKPMFTGIVEAVGRLAERTPNKSGYRVRIATDFAAQLSRGESVAVNGVCLTVTELDTTSFCADIGTETARITTLGLLPVESGVNLERSLRVDARLGGHLVQGHVDGTGVLSAVRPDGETRWLTFSYPSELAPYLVRKGSVAVDGISLTVA